MPRWEPGRLDYPTAHTWCHFGDSIWAIGRVIGPVLPIFSAARRLAPGRLKYFAHVIAIRSSRRESLHVEDAVIKMADLLGRRRGRSGDSMLRHAGHMICPLTGECRFYARPIHWQRRAIMAQTARPLVSCRATLDAPEKSTLSGRFWLRGLARPTGRRMLRLFHRRRESALSPPMPSRYRRLGHADGSARLHFEVSHDAQLRGATPSASIRRGRDLRADERRRAFASSIARV